MRGPANELPMVNEVVAAWAAAGFAGLAAGVAIYQVRVHIGQARQQATFAHIRHVAEELHALRGRDARPLRTEILAFYHREVDELSVDAARYLVFLDSVELLSLAYKHAIVDTGLVLEYFTNLLGDAYTFSEAFIDELRKARLDPTIYEHTIHLRTEARRLKL